MPDPSPAPEGPVVPLPDPGDAGRGGGGPRLRAAASLLLGCALAALFLAYGREWAALSGPGGGTVHTHTFTLMTTDAVVKLVSGPGLRVRPEAALAEAEAAARRVEALMSPFRPDSDVYRLNHAPVGTWVSVDPSTWRVAMSALRLHALTDGAFDPTVGPLKKLYPYPSPRSADAPGEAGAPTETSPNAPSGTPPPSGSAEGNGNAPERAEPPWPSEDAVRAARDATGARHLRFERDGMRLAFARPGMSLDLSALAKGFAVDEAMAALRRRGAVDAMVSIGGELRLAGTVPDGHGDDARPAAGTVRQRIGTPSATPGAASPPGKTETAAEAEATETEAAPAGSGAETAVPAPPGRRLWRTAIQHPRRGAGRIATLSRTACGVATSGDYERYFLHAGRRQSHILDPRTGRPVSGGMVSATVLLPETAAESSCMLADGVATALIVLGPEGGARFLRERGDDLFRDGAEVWWVVEKEGGALAEERILVPGPGLAGMGVEAARPKAARAP